MALICSQAKTTIVEITLYRLVNPDQGKYAMNEGCTYGKAILSNLRSTLPAVLTKYSRMIVQAILVTVVFTWVNHQMYPDSMQVKILAYSFTLFGGLVLTMVAQVVWHWATTPRRIFHEQQELLAKSTARIDYFENLPVESEVIHDAVLPILTDAKRRVETIRENLKDLKELIPVEKTKTVMSPYLDALSVITKVNGPAVEIRDWKIEIREYIRAALATGNLKAFNQCLKGSHPAIASRQWIQGKIDNLSESDLK